MNLEFVLNPNKPMERRKMRIKRLTNTSEEEITLEHKDGVKSILPPKAEVTNVEITNENELRGKVHLVADLGEICGHSNKTKLYS